MRIVAGFLAAFVCLSAFASDPGQPLDCEDWIVLIPGVTIEIESGGGYGSVLTDRLALDNEGGRISIGHCCDPLPSPCASSPYGYLPMMRWTPSGERQVIACVAGRAGPFPGTTDFPGPAKSGCYDNANESASCVRFNAITGDLHFNFDELGQGYQNYPGSGYQNYHNTRTCVLHGLSTLYDVQQTYVPPSTLGFYVPAMPEGMGGADHFDTYWGDIAHPIDFTQAHPLQCSYPAAPPHVGDYLTVADTLPTPAPGQGVYYVTSATYQGATRYGRKTMAGHITGRDPALLPACTPLSHRKGAHHAVRLRSVFRSRVVQSRHRTVGQH